MVPKNPKKLSMHVHVLNKATPIKYLDIDDQPSRQSLDHKMKLKPISSIVLDINKITPTTSSQIDPIKWRLLSQIAMRLFERGDKIKSQIK